MNEIFERHSYRGAYLPESVPRADLTKIMEAGLAAPSGCNKQTTSLIAVDDPALLAEIFAIMELSFCKSAPAVICVLTKRIVAYRDGWGKERWYGVQDYAAKQSRSAIRAAGSKGMSPMPMSRESGSRRCSVCRKNISWSACCRSARRRNR